MTLKYSKYNVLECSLILYPLLFAGALLPVYAYGQAKPEMGSPPAVTAIDSNGIDLMSGKDLSVSHELSIGVEGNGLSEGGPGFNESKLAGGILGVDGVQLTVIFGDGVEVFNYDISTGVYNPTLSSGILVVNGIFPNRVYKFYSSSGDMYEYYETLPGENSNSTPKNYNALLYKISKSSGEVITNKYNVNITTWPTWEVAYDVDYCEGSACVNVFTVWNSAAIYTLRSSNSSAGWLLKKESQDDYFYKKLINTSEVYCSDGVYCNNVNGVVYSRKKPQLLSVNVVPHSDYTFIYYDYNEVNQSNDYNMFGENLKNIVSRVRHVRQEAETASTEENYSYISRDVISPSGRQRTIRYTDDGPYTPGGGGGDYEPARVVGVEIDGKNWQYQYQSILGSRTLTTATSPNGASKKVLVQKFSDYLSRILSIEDELGNIRKYEYDSLARLTKVVSPQATYSGTTLTGGYTQYSYNAKGNVTESREVARAGTGQADLVTTAAYAASCTDLNYKTCNKPEWVRDARGNLPENIGNDQYRTDYTYSTDHGGVLTEKLPPNEQNVRLMTRYEYTPLYAQIKNSSGTLVNAEGPIYKLTRVSSCASTQTNCDQAGDTVTEYQYAHPNLLMTATTVRSGNNTVSATTLYEYDYVGNTTAVDGPLAGTVDKSYTTYDVLRRKVFEIGPDPDGAGPLKRQIVRHKYDADGLETRTESGTVNDSNGTVFSYAAFNIANPDLAPYTWATAKNMYYDGAAQLIKTEVVVP